VLQQRQALFGSGAGSSGEAWDAQAASPLGLVALGG